MLQIGNKPIDTTYVGGKLVQQVYLGSKKIYPEHGVIPKAIKESMILWYDIKRQGATNENMASNPVLRDLSGNGHDATCYNFAWNGMSGVGGYVYDYSKFRKYQDRATLEINSTSIRVLSVISQSAFIESKVSYLPVGTTIQQHKIRVTGLDAIGIPNINLKVRLGVKFSDNDAFITKDGVYDIPLHTIDGNFNYSISINRRLEECNVLIELLPIYPNALVSDGVDDYCLVEGLPLLNKEDGFTFIAKRKWLYLDENSSNTSFITKRKENNEFLKFERYSYASAYGFIYSFGRGDIINISEQDIVYCTSIVYQNQAITKGNSDDDIQNVFTIFPADTQRPQIALCSLLFFNRDLTTEEIEWVKTNLIETEQ